MTNTISSFGICAKKDFVFPLALDFAVKLIVIKIASPRLPIWPSGASFGQSALSQDLRKLTLQKLLIGLWWALPTQEPWNQFP